MAVATYRSVNFHRDDPPDSESGWTTDALNALNGSDVTFRGLVFVEDDEDTIGTAWLHFEVYLPDASGWTEFGSSKFHTPHKWNDLPRQDSWYAVVPYQFFRAGDHRFRIRLEYDGGEHLSSEITASIMEASLEGVSRSVDSGAAERSAGTSAPGRGVVSGASERTADAAVDAPGAAVAGVGVLAAVGALYGRAVGLGATERVVDQDVARRAAGMEALSRSVTAEVEDRSTDVGVEDRG